jgi:hypothetical protein
MARNRNAGEQSGEVEAPEAEATPEAAATPAAEATEAPEAEATPEAPAAPKPTAEELTEALRVAVNGALSTADAEGNVTPEATTQLQEAYRKIPPARRGNVQTEILREAMTTEGVNNQAVASVLLVMTQAPATAKTRAPKEPKVVTPPEQVAASSIAALRVAEASILAGLDTDELRSEALSLADGKLAGQIEDDAEREAFLLVVTKAVKSVSAKASKSTGTGGSRAAKKDTLSNIIERGDLAVGTVVSHGDNKATVTTDGKLDVNGTSYDNPTAAAKGAGVNGVNGWAFWQVEKDGKKVALGDLRSE